MDGSFIDLDRLSSNINGVPVDEAIKQAVDMSLSSFRQVWVWEVAPHRFASDFFVPHGVHGNKLFCRVIENEIFYGIPEDA